MDTAFSHIIVGVIAGIIGLIIGYYIGLGVRSILYFTEEQWREK